MTTKELFDEYANIIYNLRVDPKYHYCATGRTLEGIIQEVEALVRKETIEEIQLEISNLISESESYIPFQKIHYQSALKDLCNLL